MDIHDRIDYYLKKSEFIGDDGWPFLTWPEVQRILFLRCPILDSFQKRLDYYKIFSRCLSRNNNCFANDYKNLAFTIYGEGFWSNNHRKLKGLAPKRWKQIEIIFCNNKSKKEVLNEPKYDPTVKFEFYPFCTLDTCGDRDKDI